MKRIVILLLSVIGLSAQFKAQEAINFQAVKPNEGELSKPVADALKLKVEQILSRNGAGATSLYNAFVIEPQLNLEEEMQTEGLVRNVSLIKAELTLLAKNVLDGSMYGSIVVPVSGSGKGTKDETMKSLISNIKPTDPQFSRFIRNARQKIVDHYTQNCGTIVQKAQVMINTGKCKEAITYLGCVPETVPCYEQASEALTKAYELSKNLECEESLLMAQNYYIRQKYDQALDVLSKIPQNSACSTGARALTDSVKKYIQIPPQVITVEKEIVKEVPVEKVVVKEVPVEKIVVKEVPASAPVSPSVHSLINVSCADLKFEVVSCTGSESQQQITIVTRIINQSREQEEGRLYIANAIDLEGNTYSDFSAGIGYYSSKSMPFDIPLKEPFYIKKVYSKVSVLSHVELSIRNCKVTIKDLPVIWK